MAAHDRQAIRFAAALIAIAAGLVAGPERYGRLAAAFDWRSEAAIATASRIDAWIDPPPYTGRPPLVLDLTHPDEPQGVTAPEDSVLIVRGEDGAVDTKIAGGLTPVVPKAGAAPPPAGEHRWTIHTDGVATIARGGKTAASVRITALPGGVPSISLTAEPAANITGSLTLAYRLADRYGVAGARADFAREPDASGTTPRTLAPPPQAALQLPAAPNGVGDARSTIDLAEHPWAGARVLMTLSATGVSGKTGQSEPIPVTLPERLFRNPLARALVEQRRDLVLDPDHAPDRVVTALGGLSVAPELFDTPAGVYLGLGQARRQLENASGDSDLVEVAALLWSMAQQIENGDASQALRDLRAAEQALREALQRGASDEEIRRLTEAMREAAKRYMSELARKSPTESAEAPNMRQQDLDSLMDRMEDTARNGAREDAQAMLDEMQEMFENMQSARDAEASPGQRELNRQMQDLDKLLRDQQALRDDTFRRDQRERARRANPDENGDQSESQEDADQNGADQPSLDQRQRELRDRLGEIQRKLKGLGMKGEKGFEAAEGAMGEAQQDLEGDGNQPGGGKGPRGHTGKGDAVEAQGRALQALREGAQGLQQQMQGQNGKGGYASRGQRDGREQGIDQNGADPLGRPPQGQSGRTEGVLRDAVGAAERARRVLEEVRRRLADPARPQDERDYLERLMNRD
jgi:uncharacterized protein (TIGR02302 family)